MKKNSSEEIISRLRKIDLMLIMILVITVLVGTSAQASTTTTTTTNNHASVYNTCMVITNTSYDENIVTCETATGFVFEFYGIEDYFVGDIIICTMDDNGTKSIIDDKIIDTKYSGFSMDESPC